MISEPVRPADPWSYYNTYAENSTSLLEADIIFVGIYSCRDADETDRRANLINTIWDKHKIFVEHISCGSSVKPSESRLTRGIIGPKQVEGWDDPEFCFEIEEWFKTRNCVVKLQSRIQDNINLRKDKFFLHGKELNPALDILFKNPSVLAEKRLMLRALLNRDITTFASMILKRVRKRQEEVQEELNGLYERYEQLRVFRLDTILRKEAFLKQKIIVLLSEVGLANKAFFSTKLSWLLKEKKFVFIQSKKTSGPIIKNIPTLALLSSSGSEGSSTIAKSLKEDQKPIMPKQKKSGVIRSRSRSLSIGWKQSEGDKAVLEVALKASMQSRKVGIVRLGRRKSEPIIEVSQTASNPTPVSKHEESKSRVRSRSVSIQSLSNEEDELLKSLKVSRQSYYNLFNSARRVSLIKPVVFWDSVRGPLMRSPTPQTQSATDVIPQPQSTPRIEPRSTSLSLPVPLKEENVPKVSSLKPVNPHPLKRELARPRPLRIESKSREGEGEGQEEPILRRFSGLGISRDSI